MSLLNSYVLCPYTLEIVLRYGTRRFRASPRPCSTTYILGYTCTTRAVMIVTRKYVFLFVVCPISNVSTSGVVQELVGEQETTPRSASLADAFWNPFDKGSPSMGSGCVQGPFLHLDNDCKPNCDTTGLIAPGGSLTKSSIGLTFPNFWYSGFIVFCMVVERAMLLCLSRARRCLYRCYTGLCVCHSYCFADSRGST